MENFIEKVLKFLKENPRYKKRIEHIEILPQKNPIFGEVKKAFSTKINNYLNKKKIKLYNHQCEAIEALIEGENVIITTSTSSGKTLSFTIPIFEKLNQDKNATALYLYPTKALANDQLKVIKEFENLSGISVNPAIYDGDTPSSKRGKIRESSRIIISNPYEFHQTLPWHYKWENFLSNLKFIVLDEAHRYRGVFGSNVAFLIRRLKRICNFYGSNPQFVISTATIANPLEFANKLVGLEFTLINKDGSPKGKKYFIFYNPYYDGAGEFSTHQEAKDLLLLFVKNNLQTLCFTSSRKMAELIILWAKEELKEKEPNLISKITSYRAGYLPSERREIENNLKNGILKGITSTNALELGIDIGSLDSVIISGYPGTIISTWQQIGRAGRGNRDSIAVLIAFQNPLDQYFMKHPKIFFEKSHENAIIDLSNPYIVSGHLLCAASELPIKLPEDELYFGKKTREFLEALRKEGLVEKTKNGWVYIGKTRATLGVSLDNISSSIFKVISNGKVIETMDRLQAFREAHKGAVFLHQGETYIVEKLDLEKGIVQVEKKEVDYHTEALKNVEIKILEEIKKKEIGSFSVCLGRVNVKEQYTEYKIMKYDKVIGKEELDLPPLEFKTLSLWFSLPEIQEKIWKKRKEDKKIKKNSENVLECFMGGLHGAEHAMIGVIPFYVMCDRWDIGGVSTPFHPDTIQPTIFIYDGFEGGIGLVEKAFDLIREIVKMTYELVRNCPCENGCPSCIFSPKCGNENEPLDKIATISILEEILLLMK
ncbi:MAG: DEAD/DEAH box helicase [candidate division WOR-3 bacterium]